MDPAQLIENLREAIADGEEEDAARLAKEAVEAGVEPAQLIDEAINKPMDQIGKDFQNGDIFLPELILVGDAPRAATDAILPYISADQKDGMTDSTIVIGTIQGDLHDIGKNVVAGFLSAKGFRVVDLGADVPPKKYVDAAVSEKAQFICVSTLITTTYGFFEDIIELLKARNLRDKHLVVIGGGPVTPEWARKIGTDGYGRDGTDAVTLCRQLVDEERQPPLDEPVIVGALT